MRQHTIVSKSSRAGNGKHQSVAAASAIILLSLFTVVGVISVNRRYRSEEHTSELQSQSNLVCRLLLEKKKKIIKYNMMSTRLNSSHNQRTCDEFFRTRKESMLIKLRRTRRETLELY